MSKKDFIKYQHVERLGTSEVENILLGQVYVFPKIDGTNASVWLSDGEIQCGSRNRQLTPEKDNASFYQWVQQQKNLIEYLKEHPHHRLYGEWLVPHSLKTYRQSAWRNFYVFDVAIDKEIEDVLHMGDSRVTYLHYEDYKEGLEKHGINYIPPICVITNPSYDQAVIQLKKNNFLIEDGYGAGEGVVLKNYSFTNKYGRQTWAKIVTSEFKEKHHKELGAPNISGKKVVEQEIARKYITKALCDKVRSKIELDNGGFSSKDIPRLLNTVWYDFIREESWSFIKDHKKPTINYGTLNHFVVVQIKEHMPEVF